MTNTFREIMPKRLTYRDNILTNSASSR